jgi:hypothetical protein
MSPLSLSLSPLFINVYFLGMGELAAPFEEKRKQLNTMGCSSRLSGRNVLLEK